MRRILLAFFLAAAVAAPAVADPSRYEINRKMELMPFDVDSLLNEVREASAKLDSIDAGLAGISVNVTTLDRTAPFYLGSMVQDSTCWIKPSFQSAVVGYGLITYTANDGPLRLRFWYGGALVDSVTIPGPNIDIGAQGSILPEFRMIPMQADSAEAFAVGAIDHAEIFWMGDANP